jgi:hypothetical protein
VQTPRASPTQRRPQGGPEADGACPGQQEAQPRVPPVDGFHSLGNLALHEGHEPHSKPPQGKGRAGWGSNPGSGCSSGSELRKLQVRVGRTGSSLSMGLQWEGLGLPLDISRESDVCPLDSGHRHLKAWTLKGG